LEALRPPEDLKPSVWAERHRVLDRKSSPSMPGPWRNENMPHLVDIMDELVNPEIEKVIFVKPTQIGGTEILNNWLGYLVMQAPCPALLVYPNDTLAEASSENRLKPMFRADPKLRKLFKERISKKYELQFEGMDIAIVGAGSAADLSSRPRKFVGIDEADKLPGATAKEADAISLAIERTSGQTDPFVYITTTPTSRTGRGWREMEQAHLLKHRFVPCPHCKEWIELKFSQIIGAPKESGLSHADRAAQALYYCQKCGAAIDNRQKRQMLRAGKWMEIRRSAEHPRSVAYWINKLYSPVKTWEDILLAFFEAKDDPEKLQNFANSWLAEPWEDTRLKTNADMVLERQTALPRYVVPQWALLLTGGVDVQQDHLYYTIRAWGEHMTSQNIDHGRVGGLEDIEHIMNLEYRREDDSKLMVGLCAIDAGYSTDEIYEFCYRNAEWAVPIMGEKPILGAYTKQSTVQKETSVAYGMRLLFADGAKFKDLIHARLRRENGKGSWMVYQGCGQDYADQVTAEHKVVERRGQQETTRWVQKKSHADNHYLDCEVYAAAAADVMHVRTLHLQAKQEDAQPAPQEQLPEDNWLTRGLGANANLDDWLGGQ